MKHDVYVGYASEDKRIADAVCALLESEGITCFIAPRDVLAGATFTESLLAAIDACQVYVLVFSARSNESPHAARELERALSKGKPVIPFRIENVAPSQHLAYYIGTVHWLDAFTPPLDPHVARLGEAILHLLGETQKKITITLENRDIFTFPCDIIALRHDPATSGPDRIVLQRLQTAGIDIGSRLPGGTEYLLIRSKGVTGSRFILFLGTDPTTGRDYADIRAYAQGALRVLAEEIPSVRHLCLTLQGIFYGLEVDGIIRSELEGLREGIAAHAFPANLESVTILENREDFYGQARAALEKCLPGGHILVPNEPRNNDGMHAPLQNVARKELWKPSIFISFKNLDANGQPTPDSILAREIYQYFAQRDRPVFQSNISLESLGVSAYQKAIDEALDAAQVLVCVGTSRQNLESKWVRYEWESFHNDILSDVKPDGRIFSYIDGLSIAQLPRMLRQTQTIVHGPGSVERLFNFVVNALDESPPSTLRIDTPAAAGPAGNAVTRVRHLFRNMFR